MYDLVHNIHSLFCSTVSTAEVM